MDQLEESIQIIKKLWMEPKVSFSGKHYQIQEAFSAPKPIQQLPPIFIGGTGKKRILRMVAKYADYCNFGWFLDPEILPDLLDTLKHHCEKVNRDFDSVGKSFFASVIVVETQDELETIMTERAKARRLTLKEYKKSISSLNVFFGTPAVVQQGFENLIDLGFDYFQIMFPYPNDFEQSERFAKHILCKF